MKCEAAGDGTPALQLLTAPSTLLRINETAVPRLTHLAGVGPSAMLGINAPALQKNKKILVVA